MAIPREIVEQIRQLVDVVDVIGQVVTLKKTGNHFSGLCPFHRERTPSFKVFPESQNFHCFGCGEGGSIFDFVMKTEGLSFPEAVRQLAERVGVAIPRDASDADEDRLVREVSETLELAARFYATQLTRDTGQAARRYLERRGLTAATIERFRLGYAPPGWENLVRALARFRTGPQLTEAGLALAGRTGHYDRFRNRILFPILSPAGRVVGFGGRALGDEEPKYLNSPETVVYQKSRVLYALREARPQIRLEKRVLVVEGYMDALSLHQAGLGTAVATCGTSLTPDHARILARHAPEVILVFDGDAAGLRAALRGFEAVLPTGVTVRATPMPPGRDPDDVVREEGAQAFQRRVEESQDLVDFFHAQSRGEPRPRAIERLARMTALVPGEIQRREMARKASDWFKFDESTFASAVEKLVRGSKSRTPSRVLRRDRRQPQGLEADLLRASFQDPEFWGEFEALMSRPDIADAVRHRVREAVLDLLREVGRARSPVSPGAYRDRVSDPEIQEFLMELESEGFLDEDRLFRLERDLVGRLPLLALERERLRLRSALDEAVRQGDGEREAEVLSRLQDVQRRLHQLPRDEEPSVTRE